MNEFFADKFFTHKMLFFYQLNHELLLNVSDSEMKRFNEFLVEIKTELVHTKKDRQQSFQILHFQRKAEPEPENPFDLLRLKLDQ